MLLLLLPLLPFIGVVAAGIAYIASALVESVFFVYAARRTTTFRIGSSPGHPRVARDRVGDRAAGSLRTGSDRIWRGRCRARRSRSASSSAASRRSTALTSPTPGRSLGADFAGRLRPPPRRERPDLAEASGLFAEKPSPLVSVVTPVFNGAKYLRPCIESVLAQTYDRWDYTIVDNCSTDGSLAIAQEYAEAHPQISVRSNEQFVGAIENHNRAFRSISPEAKYCKLLSADDWMYPECISKLVDLAERHPSVGIVGSYSANDDGRSLGRICRSATRSSRAARRRGCTCSERSTTSGRRPPSCIERPSSERKTPSSPVLRRAPTSKRV